MYIDIHIYNQMHARGSRYYCWDLRNTIRLSIYSNIIPNERYVLHPFSGVCYPNVPFAINIIRHVDANHMQYVPENIHTVSCVSSLQWCHNERDGVSNHQPRDCLLNPLFRRGSKKTPMLHVTGICEGNSPVTGDFPTQTASNAENVSIWWRHHVICLRYIHLCYRIHVINSAIYVRVASLAKSAGNTPQPTTAKCESCAFIHRAALCSIAL